MNLRDELQTTLGSGFTVERELGGGGMSRVFVARDISLGRDVVVKVLPPEMSAEVSADRFRREIQVGAQLQHPHIVPLLSAGASNSLLFYSMPFVAGESLRERMSRGPALSCGESLRIWREVLDALSYAHSRGIVHRDIKPENILLSNKHALVTDFGIARAIQAATGETRMTATGLALGTPAYMSPEQAAGDRDVDARADIYSAGLVMYEMLAGHAPFAAESARQMVMAQLTQAAPLLVASDPSTPKALIALVMNCLDKNPSARPQSAEGVLETLDAFVTTRQTLPGAGRERTRRAMPAVITLVIVVLGAASLTARNGRLPFTTPVKPPNDTLRLAVAIVDDKFDPADANLGRSFRDVVLSELAKDPWLNVITPGTVATGLQLAGYDAAKTSRDSLIGFVKRFHTNAYIDLTVSHAAGFVFSAEAKGMLHDNSIGVVSAAANTAADIPAAMQRVAADLRRAVVRSRRALPPTPLVGLGGEMASVAIPTFLEAQSDFDRGNYVEAAAKARDATRLDSTFGPAWMTRFVSLLLGPGSNTARFEAISAAYRLRERTPSPLGRVMVDAEYFRFLGRDAEALAAFDTVARMMPSSLPSVTPRGVLYGRLRREDVAARIYHDAIDTTYSRLGVANSDLIAALLRLGKVDEANAEYRRMLTHADSNDATARLARYFIATATRDWPAVQVLATSELARRGPTARARGLQYARAVALVQGQLTRYDSLQRPSTDGPQTGASSPAPRAADLPGARVRAMMGDTAGARAIIEKGMAAVPWTSREPIDRPYAPTITALAFVGDTAGADAIAADWTTHMPQEFKLRDSLDVLTARSELALARHNPREALRLLRLGDVKGCVSCNYPRYARIFDALRMTDSVATYYEKYATATNPGTPIGDAYELARAYRRLGEIYEERRDWKRAAQRYQDFVNLWQHADASLQPAVKDVRARIERIRTRTG